LIQPLDVLDWFKKKSRYLKDLFVKLGDVSHAELAISIFDAIIAIAVLFFQAIVRVVDFFLANQMARSDIATIHQESANKQDSQRIMCYVREALRLRPLVSFVIFLPFNHFDQRIVQFAGLSHCGGLCPCL